MYRAIVFPSLLYACEMWTVYQRHARKLSHFHTTRLITRLINIKWQNEIPDSEVRAQEGLPSIHTILMQSQIRWAGHVARMPDHRLSNDSTTVTYKKVSAHMGAKETFQRKSEDLRESVCHQPQHMGALLNTLLRTVLSGAPPCTKAQQQVR